MRYRGTMNSGYRGRHNESVCAMPSWAKVNGWDAGVRVEPDHAVRQDTFRVYMTGGSHDAHGKKLLGLVWDSPDGPCWEPASKPGRIPARIRFEGYPDAEIIAAIPAHSHLNQAEPGEFVTVVHYANWPSGSPRFGTVRVSWVNNQWIPLDTQDELSQTAAVTAMITRAGHGRTY